MSCSCRLAPVRAFIRGLAQVHRLEAPSPTFWAASQHLVAARQARPLHRSRQLNQQDAVAPPASPRGDAPEGLSIDSTSAPSDAAPSPSDGGDGTFPAGPRRGSFNKSKSWSKGDGSHFRGYGNKSDHTRGQSGSPSWKSSRDRTDSRPFEKKNWKSGQDKPARDDAHRTHDDGELPKKKEDWRAYKEILQKKFPHRWMPRKRLSPDALVGIRALNAQFPDVYNSATLSQKFEVSPEHIRRILKSKWQPSTEEEEDRQERWHRRGRSVWERKAALGVKPPKKWREEGINREPEYHVRRKYAIEKQREWEEEEREKYRATLGGRGGGTKVL